MRGSADFNLQGRGVFDGGHRGVVGEGSLVFGSHGVARNQGQSDGSDRGQRKDFLDEFFHRVRLKRSGVSGNFLGKAREELQFAKKSF